MQHKDNTHNPGEWEHPGIPKKEGSGQRSHVMWKRQKQRLWEGLFLSWLEAVAKTTIDYSQCIQDQASLILRKKRHQRETFLGAPQKERWALRSKLGLVDCSYGWPCWVVVMYCRSELRLVVMQEDHRDSDLFLWTVSWFFSTLGLGTKTDDLSSVPGNSTVEREGQFPFP